MQVLKASSFFRQEKGVLENYQETRKVIFFHILVDALVEGERDPHEIETFAVEAIRRSLRLPSEKIQDRTLTKALEAGHSAIRAKYKDFSSFCRLSALVLAQIPSSEGSEWIIAGVGDLYCYRIEGYPLPLVFMDPHNRSHSLKLSVERRFLSLSNCLGQGECLDVRVIRFASKPHDKLLALSYGCCSYFSQKTISQLGHFPFDAKKGITKALLQAPFESHRLKVTFIQNEEISAPLSLSDPAPLFSKESVDSVLKRRPLKPLMVFCILFIFLIGGGVLFTIKKPFSLYKSHEGSFFLSQPGMVLDLSPQNEPHSFSLIKERALIHSLSEKNKKQGDLIDKLYIKIREQNRILRDLQLKAFEHQALKNCSTQKPKQSSPVSKKPEKRNWNKM